MVAATLDLARSFYARDPLAVAPDLLNKVLIGPNGSGRIVEVEAYDGANDPGSHAFRGSTPRTETMFGPPGHLYVYFSYGMHWCANVVCREEGSAAAVLIRALAPLDGLEQMRAARPAAKSDRDLCRGPARLCAALGIDGRHKGIDLVSPSAEVRLTAADVVGHLAVADRDATHPVDAAEMNAVIDRRTREPAPATTAIVQTTRVGLSKGKELPWRWYVASDPHVSRS